MVNSTPFPSLKLVLWYQNNGHLSSQRHKTQLEVGKAFPFCLDCHKRRIMWWAAVAPLRSERLLKATVRANKRLREGAAACSSLQCLQLTDGKGHDYLLRRADFYFGYFSAHNAGSEWNIMAVVSVNQSLRGSQTCLLCDLHNCCPY